MATYEQFIIHLVSNPPDPLEEVAPWVAPALAKVVHRAIEHDTSARIQNCTDLARELLEAHPLAGVRPALSTAEMADTWADEGVRSPYATEPGSSQSPFRGASEPPNSRTAAKGSTLDDSVEIDVDVSDSGTPPPPRAVPSVITQSGVREPADAPTEDLTEDAPQFFDRKAIERLSIPPTSSPSGPQAPEVHAVVPGANADNLGTTFRTRKSGPGLQLLGVPIAWAALAFIAVGLIVAVALALR
jgi:hypothetical protein